MTWAISLTGNRPLKLYGSIRAWLRTYYGRYLLQSSEFAHFTRNHGVIVAFHRVNDDLTDSLTCSESKFRNFCAFFKSRFEVISLPEMIKLLNRNESVAGKLVITFDDGYRDNFLNAAPILKEMELPASFFITTGFIGNETVAWWDEKHLSSPAWMSWDEVRQLSEEGFDVGAHTVTHADLGKLSEPEILQEVHDSKESLTQQLGYSKMELFAYPYGGQENITEVGRSIIKDAGFVCCLSCFGGTVDSASDPYSLNRIAISEWYRNPQQLAVDLLKFVRHRSR